MFYGSYHCTSFCRLFFFIISNLAYYWFSHPQAISAGTSVGPTKLQKIRYHMHKLESIEAAFDDEHETMNRCFYKHPNLLLSVKVILTQNHSHKGQGNIHSHDTSNFVKWICATDWFIVFKICHWNSRVTCKSCSSGFVHWKEKKHLEEGSLSCW